MFQYTIGIDFRADQLFVVAVKAGLKGHQVAAHTTFRFENGKTPGERVKLAAELVDDFIKQHHFGIPDIYVAIPRELVIARDIRLPLAVKENLRTTLGYEMGKYIPLSSEDVYFDVLTIEESREDSFLRVLLFVVRKSDLETFLALATHLNKSLSGIEIEATAMTAYLKIHEQDHRDQCMGIVQRDDQCAEINIYEKGVLAFNKFIQSSDAQDSLSTELIAALSALRNNHVIAADEIKWHGYQNGRDHTWVHDLKRSADIDLAPLAVDGIDLPGADSLPAYALALRGLRQEAGGMNLLPPALRKKPNRMAFFTMWGLILLTVLMVLAYGGSRIARHRLTLSRIDGQLASLQSEVKAVEQLNEQADKIEKQLQGIAKLAQDRLSTLAVLQELSTRIPKSAWVNDLTLSSKGVQINGFADSASDLLEILEASPLFDDVVFLAAITRTKEDKERFRIGMAFQQ